MQTKTPPSLPPLPAKQSELRPPSFEVSKALKECPESRKTLAVLILDSFRAFPQFGKDPESLESTTRVFLNALADYPIEKIAEAFRVHWAKVGGFPDPSDLRQIILRDGRPPFERSVYVNICKKPADERTQAEWEYKRTYENFMIDE